MARLLSSSSGDYAPAYPFGDLGHDGVAEGCESVQPSGNPINLSVNTGFNFWPMYVPWRLALLLAFAPPQLSLPEARGVGHNEHSFPWMWRTKGARWKQCPLRIKPVFGHLPENLCNSPVKQTCDVFHDDDRRS
jgi:hypothetical protein